MEHKVDIIMSQIWISHILTISGEKLIAADPSGQLRNLFHIDVAL